MQDAKRYFDWIESWKCKLKDKAMDELNGNLANRWSGKSAEDVLARSFHELRNPIFLINGYLEVLKSAEMSVEQKQHILDSAIRSALTAREIVESVFQYIKEQRNDS
jgi:signal transduction histidine kinase